MTNHRTRGTSLHLLALILGVLIIAAPVLACETPTPTPTPVPPPTPFSCGSGKQSLVAADNEVVGCVAVTNDDSYLYVTFSSSPSVQMRKASWTWSTNAIINPLPETFLETYTFKDGEQSYSFPGVLLDHLVASDVDFIYLSAYAVVEEKDVTTCTWISSDGKETYTAYNNPRLGPDVPGTSSPRSGTAVMAYYSPWHNPSLYLAKTSTPFKFTVGKWIWESYKVKNPWKGDIVDFKKTFTLNGDPVSGMIWITADDGYDMSLNGGAVGKEGLNTGWRTSTLKYAYVPGHGLWKSVEAYDLMKTPGKLVKGTNTLSIQTANRYMGCDNYLPAGVTATESDFDTGSESGAPLLINGGDLVACGGSCAEPKGTTSTNIGALIYEAKICTAASSTQDAWVYSDVNGVLVKYFDYQLKKVNIRLSPSPAYVNIAEKTSQLMTVTVLDRSSAVTGAPLVFTTDFGTFADGKQDATAKTDGNGMAAVTISSSTPGTALLTTWIDANANGKLDSGEWTSSTKVKWQVATSTSLEPAKATVQLPEEDQVLIANVSDQDGERMPNVLVTFATTVGSITGTNPVITDEDGSAMVTVSSSTAGTAEVTAIVGTKGSGGELTATSTVKWAYPKISLSPGTATKKILAGTSQDFTALAVDQGGMVMEGVTVTFSIDLGSFADTTRVTGVKTDNNGLARVTVIPPTDPVTATVRAWFDVNGDRIWDNGEPYAVSDMIWEPAADPPVGLAAEPTIPPAEEPTVPPAEEPTVPPAEEPTIPPATEPTTPPQTG